MKPHAHRWEEERVELVRHLRANGIVDARVLEALGRVDRHCFVPEPLLMRAYEDSALPIGRGQTISQPYTVAVMSAALQVAPGAAVLEIGTGSGYQSAILCALGARVFTIERDLDLLASARRTLDALGYRVASKGGDGTVGWSEFAPYNGIIVTAGSPSIPDPLVRQLADGGRLVIPVGDRTVQNIVVLSRHGDRFDRREVGGFKFVPLIGKNAWQ